MLLYHRWTRGGSKRSNSLSKSTWQTPGQGHLLTHCWWIPKPCLWNTIKFSVIKERFDCAYEIMCTKTRKILLLWEKRQNPLKAPLQLHSHANEHFVTRSYNKNISYINLYLIKNITFPHHFNCMFYLHGIPFGNFKH